MWEGTKRGNKMCCLLEINFHRVFVIKLLNRLMVRCEILLLRYMLLVQYYKYWEHGMNRNGRVWQFPCVAMIFTDNLCCAPIFLNR
jgi:hypothetical protein